MEQDIALNRRKDSGKMKFRLDVKHSPSNVSRNGMVIDEPIYDELEMKPSKKQRKIIPASTPNREEELEKDQREEA